MAELQSIGRYQIIDEIGRGGMAVVFRAFDPRFEREVALKVLPQGLLHDPGLHARFEREAKTIAALEHPAIVPVYDFGEEQGQPYLVMRLMTGGSLASRLADGRPLPVEEISRIMARISSALDAAHGQGITHRDLKPGNILFDKYGDAYLSDFGIVRLADSAVSLTKTQGTVGTPGYMSPEQIEGGAVDGRADIYALGVIVFEMLTGHKLFVADSAPMILVKQLTEPPPPIAEMDSNLPQEVNQVIDSTLSRKPDGRPATAGDVARLLAEAIAASNLAARKLQELAPAAGVAAGDLPLPTEVETPASLEAAPPVPSEPAVPAPAAAPAAARRSRRWLVLAAFLAVVVIAALVYFAVNAGFLGGGATPVAQGATAVPTAPPSAPTKPPPAGDERPIAERMQTAVQALEGGHFGQVVEETSAILALDEQNVGAHTLRGIALRELGDNGAAVEEFSRAIELAPGDPNLYIERSLVFYNLQDWDPALADANQCLAVNPDFPRCYYQRGLIFEHLGDGDQARADYGHFLEIIPAGYDCLECIRHSQEFLAAGGEAGPPGERPPFLYDDFEDKAFDGRFNPDLWTWEQSDNPPGPLFQEGGVLHLIHETGSEANWLYANQYRGFQFTQPYFFETDLMVDPELGAGTALFRLHNENDRWVVDCGARSDPELNARQQARLICLAGTWNATNGHSFASEGIDIPYGTWHKVRIAVEPQSMTFSYYIDGQFAGEHAPEDPDAVRGSHFVLHLEAEKAGPDPFIAHYDNIFAGPLE